MGLMDLFLVNVDAAHSTSRRPAVIGNCWMQELKDAFWDIRKLLYIHVQDIIAGFPHLLIEFPTMPRGNVDLRFAGVRHSLLIAHDGQRRRALTPRVTDLITLPHHSRR